LEKPRLKPAVLKDYPTTTQSSGDTREVLQRPNGSRTRYLPNSHPPFKCFGCNSHEHRLGECSWIRDLTDQGELVYDWRGRLSLPRNQGPLERGVDKSLIEIYHRVIQQWLSNERKTQTNLIMVDCNTLKCGSSNYTVPEMSVSGSDDSEDEELVYIPYELQTSDDDDDDGILQSYKVVRAECKEKAMWKGIMDGVYIPPKKGGGDQRCNEVVLKKHSPEIQEQEGQASPRLWSTRQKEKSADKPQDQ